MSLFLGYAIYKNLSFLINSLFFYSLNNLSGDGIFSILSLDYNISGLFSTFGISLTTNLLFFLNATKLLGKSALTPFSLFNYGYDGFLTYSYIGVRLDIEYVLTFLYNLTKLSNFFFFLLFFFYSPSEFLTIF